MRGWVYVLLRIKSGAEGGIRANMGGWVFFLVAGNCKLAVEKKALASLFSFGPRSISPFSLPGQNAIVPLGARGGFQAFLVVVSETQRDGL